MSAPQDRLVGSATGWNRREEVLEAFEAAWQRGERPKLEDYLSTEATERTALLGDLVRLDLEFRLKLSEAARLEDYLGRFPELEQDRPAVLKLIQAEFDWRNVGPGTVIPWQEHVQRFPNYAQELLAIRSENSTLNPTPEGAATITVSAPRPKAGLLREDVAPPGYEIQRELGRGGMGVVYLATQTRAKRLVALKMILAGAHATDHDLERFRIEGEAVARLQHPNIVQVHEVGEHEGCPFFSLEYLDGGTLAATLSGEPQPPATAARMTEMLAHAVAAAHRAGIVHRDLKPGNILLSQGGNPKVADFGLAKQLDTDQPLSMTGDVMGTPPYMAPEQATGRIKDIGPAADVYALGAMLYEMLTGRPPFRGATKWETLELVCKQEPVAPTQLQPKVPRDLETICLKCLQKEPHKRYASADALADDLRRFINNEPVLARPIGKGERLLKWARRRPALAALIAVSALAAFGLGIGGWWSSAVLSAAIQREHEARELAEKNFKLARTAVDRYHTDVSESVLLREPGMQPLRKKLLEAAREFYEKFVNERGKDPGVKGELGKAIFRLAQIIGDIGSETQAVKLHEQAAELLEKLVSGGEGTDFKVDLATCYHHLGRLYRLTDQLGKSEQSYEKALTVWQQLLQDEPKSDRYLAGLARSQLGLGNLYQVTRRLDKATELYQKALEHRQALAKAHPETDEYQRDLAVNLSNLAMVYRSTGKKVNEARQTWEKAEAIQKTLAQERPTISQYQNDLARTHFNLGDLYARLGKSVPAITAYQQAAEIWRALTERHPAVNSFQINRAEAYTALADVLRRSGNMAKAEEASHQALKVKHKLAASHNDTPSYRGDLARGYIALGDVLRSAKESDKAEEAYNEGIKIQEKLAGEQPLAPHYQVELARGCTHLGLLYEDVKSEDKAAASYNKAIALWEKLIKEHPGDVQFASGLAQTCLNLGNLAAANGHQAQALPWYERALANASQRDKPLVRLRRVLPLAKTGKYREAAAEADLLSSMARAGEPLFCLACTYAVSATAVAADGKLADAERRRLADQYAGRAMKLLNAAADAGFFKTRTNVHRLTSDPDLEVLRTRVEFKTFVKTTRTTNSSLRTLPILERRRLPALAGVPTLPHLPANRVVPV